MIYIRNIINLFLYISLILMFSQSCTYKKENDKVSPRSEKLSKQPQNKKQQNNNREVKDLNNNDIIQDQEKPLGSYRTKILDRSEGRLYNLYLASQKLTGHIVNSGEVFSFNSVIGEADEENGFKKAKVLIEKKAVIDEGGGICQISSTLYNATLISGMEILERHSHSRDVGYIEQGKDAAISYGDFDFKFKNTKPFPVRIDAKLIDFFVVVEIFQV